MFYTLKRIQWISVLLIAFLVASCGGDGTNQKDTQKPVITLNGASIINLAKGQPYTELGATVSDNIDSNLTIKITGTVDSNTVGTYIISYSAQDKAKNKATAKRTVNVEALACTQVITLAFNPTTKEEKEFATPCDVPDGWIIVSRSYGKAGNNAIAPIITEPLNGNAVAIMPKGVTSENPIPVVFFAPGFKGTDYNKYITLLNFIASHGYAVIFAKDFSGMNSDGMITSFKQMVASPSISSLIDTTRIGVIGHSSGGGHTFKILSNFKETKGWGENGRFILALEPWFALGMHETNMKALPANTNVVFQQYGEGGNNTRNNTDPRIPLTLYYLLESISDNQKDYQIFVNADHGYPSGNNDYSDKQGILKTLDALMEVTFKGSPGKGSQQLALELGNDDPYNDGHGIQVVNLISNYKYKCNGSNTYINHCAIHAGARNPESTFTSIPTNTEITKPELKAEYIDREFGKKVIRLTDRINQDDDPKVNADGSKRPRANAHPYPKTQAWNSDMTMLKLGYRFYDASTLDEISLKKDTGDTYTAETNNLSALNRINGSLDEKKWSNITPNIFYGVYNGSGSYNGNLFKGIINRKNKTIHYELVKSFASNDYSFDRFTLGKYEGNIDFNDQYVAFAARKKGFKYLTAIVYDIKNNKVIRIKDFPSIAWPDQGQVFDWLSISPFGNYVLFSTDDKIYKYDRNLNYLGQLAQSGGHGDLGVDTDGIEAYVQYEYGANNGIWIYRLSDNKRIRLLPDKYNGGHISCRNYNYQGWCYASTTEPGYKEIIAIKLDYTGPDNHIVQRIVQTQTSALRNSMGNVSPDGKQVLFESDWRDANIHWTERDTYLVK